MSPAKFFGGMLISYGIMATALAPGLKRCWHRHAHEGTFVWLGGLAWITTACVTMTHQLASGRHLNAYLIDVSCQFVYLLPLRSARDHQAGMRH